MTGCRTPEWPGGCNTLDCHGRHQPSSTCCQSCEEGDHCGCCDLFDVDKAVARAEQPQPCPGYDNGKPCTARELAASKDGPVGLLCQACGWRWGTAR